MKRTFFLAFVLCFCFVVQVFGKDVLPGTSENASLQVTARPSSSGQLSVKHGILTNEKGDPAFLHGVSTHGINWYPDYINEPLFQDLSSNWNCNLIRLAMYSEDYLKYPKENLAILHKGIEAAIESDMYVIVDWHILEDRDPNQHIQEAEQFFAGIAEEYAGVPNVLYEICNEPNGPVTWEDICSYANELIPLIRSYSPEAVIFVGTPDYDRDLTSPQEAPLPFENIMYSFHFYTASHHEEMLQILSDAVDADLPVFITECGITEENGDGRIDYEYAEKWYTYLAEHQLGFVVWNLSNKQESSSFIKATSTACFALRDEDLTDTGKWVRSLLQETPPDQIPRGAVYPEYSFWDFFRIQFASLGRDSRSAVKNWPFIALGSILVLAAAFLILKNLNRKSGKKLYTYDTYVNACSQDISVTEKKSIGKQLRHILIIVLLFLSLIYLCWRVVYSINIKAGWLPIVCNILLLMVEFLGFLESCIHYANMMSQDERPLPVISDEEFPDVDIFIATYNEPEELLQKTINGCKHLKYPDASKVHIWICDDNRRSSMKELALSMGVGYFDRPDNQGAKAGNLNHAMGLTSAPYIVTLDADMIVRSDFLLKTIPYFVHVEKCGTGLPEEERKHLGLLQTPQCFYDPDVFQFALYSERAVPNEQDFFYRAIEVGKTSTNSVIYGGSNTVLSRKALEDIGGFYTGSITEDFATGMLIESAGYLSLATPEPLASGMTPNTFEDHIKQRTRWGRGVINTAKALHLVSRKGLSFLQKLSYLSSVVYWYSPLKNLIYLLAPIMFAVFNIPVFRCSWLELLVFWLPMFILQDLTLRIIGRNKISLKWSSIYETCVMPFLLVPVIKETLGITLSTFVVTDKSGKTIKKRSRLPYMFPFLLLTALSVFGIIRVILIANLPNLFGMFIILFWLIRNLYSIVMALFLISGRDTEDDTESVYVKDGELAALKRSSDERVFEGITTGMTEHNMLILLDESGMKTGDLTEIGIDTPDYHVSMKGIITHVRYLRLSEHCIVTVEILDYFNQWDEYLQILYDRIPSLPQSLTHDLGIFGLLWRNIGYRLIKTVR